MGKDANVVKSSIVHPDPKVGENQGSSKPKAVEEPVKKVTDPKEKIVTITEQNLVKPAPAIQDKTLEVAPTKSQQNEKATSESLTTTAGKVVKDITGKGSKEQPIVEKEQPKEVKEPLKEEKKEEPKEEEKEEPKEEKKEEPKEDKKQDLVEKVKEESQENLKEEQKEEKKENVKEEKKEEPMKTEVQLTTTKPVVITKPPPPIAPQTIERVIPDKAPRYENIVIPKIVHVTWFYPEKKCDFHFYDLICLLSVHKFIKPEKIYVWFTDKPCGKWWNEAKEKIPYIELRYMEAPTSIYGHEINVPEHKSDVARMSIIEKYGGIYMDLDIIVLKSWDPLLHYNFTLAAESTQNFGNGAIISTPNNTFIKMWKEGYHDFNDKAWAKHSLFLPFTLARNNPELVHVEWDSILRPTWKELNWLYTQGKLWDWSTSYAMHLYYRFHGMKHNPEDIKTMNTTLGQIFRHVYYGTSKLMN